MTMSQVSSPTTTDKDQSRLSPQEQCDTSYFDFSQVEKSQQQQQKPVKRHANRTQEQLSKEEQIIIEDVDRCFKNWYEPWKRTYLENGPEFGAIFNLMESLIHIQDQILCNETELPIERSNAIANGIPSVIDLGNAILNLDMILRTDDGTLREADPMRMTTIELYRAHVKAHERRSGNLNAYFKVPGKRHSNDGESPTGNLTVPQVSPSSIRMSTISGSNLPSPVMDRSKRCSVGSSHSMSTLTLNGHHGEGRRTPQAVNRSLIEIVTQPSMEDLSESELEKRHLIATLRSGAFRDQRPSPIRITLLQSALVKIENLMVHLTSAEKLNDCFDLLDELLNSIEGIPEEFRKEEVQMIANSLFKTMVRKVYVDDRDNDVSFQRTHWSTYLISLIRMMSETDYKEYINSFHNLSDLSAFLKDYLFVIQKLISRPSEADARSEPMEPIFPAYWIEMTLTASSALLKSLMFLKQLFDPKAEGIFASNMQLQHNYIDCLLYFALQDVLEPNRQMLKRRQRILADDLLRTSAMHVWIGWDSLNRHQRYQILEDIVEPLLKVCITLTGHMRQNLLSIFYDMMHYDFTSQYQSPRSAVCDTGTTQASVYSQWIDIYALDDKQRARAMSSEPFASKSSKLLETRQPTIPRNSSSESLPYLDIANLPRQKQNTGNTSASDDGTVLTKFTHLIVGRLYKMMLIDNLADDEFKNDLCSAISGESSSTDYWKREHSKIGFKQNSPATIQFKCMARHTSNLISEFIQICLDSRQANKLHYNHLHLLCLFKLILFFRDKVDRIELYLENLHKLWRLHHNAGRFVEAGFTLLEHAISLPWSNKPLEGHYRIITRSFQTNQPMSDYTQLKMFLYTTIIEYFDQGQLWEAAVPLCRELMHNYQFKLFDYSKLAALLAKMSQFFENIANGNLRSHPEYFRVTFYGCGFPDCLRNSTLVYRGKAFEKLGDFQATLLNKYPDAKLLATLEQPAESSLNEPEAKYLQINACTPVVNLKSKFATVTGSADVDVTQLHDPILDYYKHNECDKFEFSRRLGGGGDEFATMWLQRVTLTTNSLPGMLPFFIVFLQETRIISPIECAIEVMERSNDGLSRMVKRFKVDKRHEENVQRLCQLLTGVVVAAVNGGITKYEEAFFEDARGASRAATSQAPTNTPATYSNDPTQVPLSPSSASASQVAQNTCHDSDSSSASTTSANHLTPAAAAARVAGADKCRAPNTISDRPHVVPTQEQIERLKRLIAGQVPLLDQAIRLHGERVDDSMRPQHELLEASYKRLKNHIMSMYSRYLPDKYNRSPTSAYNTLRSYRSFARSPNRSNRSEMHMLSVDATITPNRLAARASDEAYCHPSFIVESRDKVDGVGQLDRPNRSNIPYEHLRSERGSPSSAPRIASLRRNSNVNPPSQLSLRNCSGASDLDEPDFVPPPPPKESAYAYNNYAAEDTYVALSDINTRPPPPLPPTRLRSSTPTRFSDAPYAYLLQDDNDEHELETNDAPSHKKIENDDTKLVII